MTTQPLPVQPMSRAPLSLTGSLPCRHRSSGLGTCRVSGIWFGAAAAPPDARLAGLHGDLTVTRDGDFFYQLRTSASGRLEAVTGSTHIEEMFSLNLTDTAGASCVAQLTVGIRAQGGVVRLQARYQVVSTVTERYCLNHPQGLALLCMETGEHFVMCEVDTPLTAVARSHQREFFGIGGQHLLRIDPINGNTIWIGILDQPCQIRSLECAPDGLLYGVDSFGDLYRIQPSNGATTLVVKRTVPSLTRGAMTCHEGGILWTTADNRLHRYDLQTQVCRVVLEQLQPVAQSMLHDRVIAMMPALDGGIFVATLDGVLRLNLGNGEWTHTGVRAKLADVVMACAARHNAWGGREPEPPQAREPSALKDDCQPALVGH